MNNFSRPDERVLEAEQERAERSQGRFGTAASIATGLGGAALTSKIMPFLSKYIPTDLAIKGISKISPKIGSFLQKGLSMGLDAKEGLDFIKEKFEGKEPEEKKNKTENIISQHSPNLFAFMEQEIGKGRRPDEAAAIARLPANGFAKEIDAIEKKAKAKWSDIISSIFGGQQQAQQQPQGMPQMGQQAQQMGQQQQQPGQGQEKLMAILQKLQQMRGGK